MKKIFSEHERGFWLYTNSKFCIEDCIEIAKSEEEFKYYYDKIKGERNGTCRTSEVEDKI
ncbi:hypothetical protein CL634_07000 [bacterium]|nr:hypothetical protein [bacterium]